MSYLIIQLTDPAGRAELFSEFRDFVIFFS